VIRRLASRAHGVVTRAELLSAGVSPEAIRQRVNKGLLSRIHRGFIGLDTWHRALKPFTSPRSRHAVMTRCCRAAPQPTSGG
jgi:hypothetical protein